MVESSLHPNYLYNAIFTSPGKMIESIPSSISKMKARLRSIVAISVYNHTTAVGSISRPSIRMRSVKDFR
jgi:hypothetical protein